METLRENPESKDLTDDELMALQLYTGSSYKLLNDFLRQLQHADNKKRAELLSKQQSWVATILHINAGIRKLCKQTQQYPVTYRGVGGVLTPNFLFRIRGLIAATEYGFMSTSEDESKAMEFAKGEPRSTVFVVKCRQEDAGGYHMGAQLEWCTMIPGEREVLFPPLTMFEILDRHRKDNITTITFYLKIIPQKDRFK